MSTIISAKSEKFMKNLEYPQVVFIKAFRGEPIRLKCLGNENSCFIVLGIDGKTQTRLKNRYVYYYDEELYEKLKKAFDTQDNKELEINWQKAKQILT